MEWLSGGGWLFVRSGVKSKDDEHILEMFSVGLMSRAALELDARQNSFQLGFRFRERHLETLGEGLGALLMDMPFRLCFYFRSI